MRLISGLVLAAIAASATGIAMNNESNKKIDDLNAKHQEELNIMQDALDKSEEELNNYKLLLAQQALELDNLKVTLAEKQIELDNLKIKLAEKDAEILELQSQIDSLTSEVNSLNEVINRLTIEVETYKGQLGIANTAAYFSFNGEEITGYTGPEQITSICFPSSYSLGDIVTKTKAIEDYFTLRSFCSDAGIFDFSLSNEATEETITITSEEEFYSKMSIIRTYFTNYGTSVITYSMQGYIDGNDFQVKSIADSAFYSNKTLTGVAFAEGIETINNYAFYNCTAIKKITLPDSLKVLGDGNFQELDTSIYTQEGNGYYLPSPTNLNFCFIKAINTSVEEIRINENTVIVGPRALQSCTALEDKNIIIPSNVIYLGDYSLALTVTANSIELPVGVKFGTEVFRSSHFKNTIWEKSDEEKGYSFKDGKLTITSINDGIIDRADRWDGWPQIINSIEFTDQLNPTSISDNAFVYTSISSIQIPETITEIGWSAFEDTLLTSIDLSNLNLSWLNETFNFCTLLESVKLPNTITYLGQGVFENCWKLKTINIPINLQQLGSCTFRYCKAIKELTLPATVTNISSNNCFTGMDSLSSLTLNSLVELSSYTFENTPSLADIYVPAEFYDNYYASPYLSDAHKSLLKVIPIDA